MFIGARQDGGEFLRHRACESIGHKSCMEGVFNPSQKNDPLLLSAYMLMGINESRLALSFKKPNRERVVWDNLLRVASFSGQSA